MNSFVLENSVNGSPNNYLGFVNLPNQVHRKSVKKGFEFTLMVVGESGLGKSTLINSLFLTKLYKNRELPNVEEKLEKTIEITTQQVDVEEKGVKLKLTVVDTPGYGDNLNNKGSIEPIVKYIDYQFEKYLDYENGLNRRNMVDTRVHCCFYFISPISYGLKPIDIEFMKQLHTKVNIIPIIAKADSLTKDEVLNLKKRILSEIQKNEICIYTIPDCDTDEDPEFLKQISEIKDAVPFAISSSIDKFEINGKSVFGRQYPFGVVEVENPEHSDFVKLRSMLVSHMQDLREVTNELHYENFRSIKLANGLQANNNGLNDSGSISSNFQLEDEKDKILKKKEEELKLLQEKLEKMQEQMKMKIEA